MSAILLHTPFRCEASIPFHNHLHAHIHTPHITHVIVFGMWIRFFLLFFFQFSSFLFCFLLVPLTCDDATRARARSPPPAVLLLPFVALRYHSPLPLFLSHLAAAWLISETSGVGRLFQR